MFSYPRCIKMKPNYLIVFLCVSINTTLQSDRISTLEDRIESLELAASNFAADFASRYGLKRQCEKHVIENAAANCDDKIESGATCSAVCHEGFSATLNSPNTIVSTCQDDGTWSLPLLCFSVKNCTVPSVAHGEAWCKDQLTPGARCYAVCNSGYISTPGKHLAICEYSGNWTVQLQCEIPLLLVSGGIVDRNRNRDSGVELLSFYPSQGCERNMTDMPLAGGSHRILHNLIYVPPYSVLACNGNTSETESSCDELDIRTNKWTHHSYPNSRNGKTIAAAQSFRLGNSSFLAGGWLTDSSGKSTVSSRILELPDGTNEWRSAGYSTLIMLKGKASFCAVSVKEDGALFIGGIEHNWRKDELQTVSSMQRDSVMGGFSGSLGLLSHVIDGMNKRRAGHGCTVMPEKSWYYHEENKFQVLVSGGGRFSSRAALNDAEVFSWWTNRWSNIPKMNVGRAGHAVVAVGKKVLAVGGDDEGSNPRNVYDSIEEYEHDVEFKKVSWKISPTKLKKPRSDFGYTLVPHSIFEGCFVSPPPPSWICRSLGKGC